MSRLKTLLVTCLLLCPGIPLLAAGPDGDIARLIGTWELVGLGDATGNVTTPRSLAISFLASGECHVRVWERGEAQPDEAPCGFALSNGVLELTPRTPGTAEFFRVTWDDRLLVLEPLEHSGRHPAPLRFEKRAGAAL